jgi:hypothetical protein
MVSIEAVKSLAVVSLPVKLPCALEDEAATLSEQIQGIRYKKQPGKIVLVMP